jgi:hypothetical protein
MRMESLTRPKGRGDAGEVLLQLQVDVLRQSCRYQHKAGRLRGRVPQRRHLRRGQL